MPVLTRSALESSPLADLHVIAGELGIDGYRRLRKADLVASIVERQGGDPGEPDETTSEAAAAAFGTDTEPQVDDETDAVGGDEEDDDRPKRRRGTRGGRGRRRNGDGDAEVDAESEVSEAADEAVSVEDGVTDEGAGDEDERPARRRRGGRRDSARDGEPRRENEEDRVVSGPLEIVANGSGFLRLNGPDPSDDDVYVSAAQIRRCELVSGDVVSGPVREPRRSERFPSLVRVDTINDRPADEVSEGTHFEDLPCALPSVRFALGSEDPTLKAIEWLTPIGRGSRATIVGDEHAGKTEALLRLAGALDALEDLEVHVVLAGVRPEEASSPREGAPAAVAAVSAAAGAEAQQAAIERALDTAKRVAARGGHVAVLVDTLVGLPPHVARRILASARAIVDGGSLTVVATAAAPVGGETTIITLDRVLTRTGRFPALDLVASGTVRPELLVGDPGAEAIATARADALEG